MLLHLDLRELSQKITRYLKSSQRVLSLPIGEVMLNRKGKLYVRLFLFITYNVSFLFT